LAVLVAASWQASAALGADSVYYNNGGAIVARALDNSAGQILYGEGGIALDPAAGKIYWAEKASFGTPGKIGVGNLDGSGSPQTLFAEAGLGLAIDPAAGKIYWTSPNYSGAVRVGNLDGSGAHDLYTGERWPRGVAIDPAAGKIYWTAQYIGANNATLGKIRVGNLDGSGAQNLYVSQTGLIWGLAIDSAAGKIYWTDGPVGSVFNVRVANLDGSGARDLYTGETSGFGTANGEGLAIDPSAGKMYWADCCIRPQPNNPPIGALRVGNLDGSGVQDLFPVGVQMPFLALLRSPAGVGAPQVSGGSSAGSVLSCSQGSWASDLEGAFLYRAPHSFAYQWSLNGADIPGATASSYTASAGGSYTCRETATNQAGSTAQTSAAHTVNPAPSPPQVAPILAPVVPSLSQVAQSHGRWREGNGLAQIASVHRPPIGTTFGFTLNESATVRFAFTQNLPGRKVHGRCVARTSKNLGRPSCTRTVTFGAFSFTAGAGAHKVRFQGRISKHNKLKPGRYTLIITATNAAGQHATARLTFTIVT
jgi:DNA-binding beta-propeller fold protein YncE